MLRSVSTSALPPSRECVACKEYYLAFLTKSSGRPTCKAEILPCLASCPTGRAFYARSQSGIAAVRLLRRNGYPGLRAGRHVGASSGTSMRRRSQPFRRNGGGSLRRGLGCLRDRGRGLPRGGWRRGHWLWGRRRLAGGRRSDGNPVPGLPCPSIAGPDPASGNEH